jgi:hypothetical protein
MPVQSLEDCYRIADETEHERERSAINFAAYTAQTYRRHLVELAWAIREPNKQKRLATLNRMLMELQANNESTSDLPSKE